MAFYTGYITLPITSYAVWKNAVLGNGYDADGSYGDQCWDLAAEFWYNVGFPQLYPQTGPNGYAYECWTVSRFNNIGYNGETYFDLITNFEELKTGDIIVFAGTSSYPAGHIAFADENYNPEKGGVISILGQNQGTGGTPTPVVNPNGGTTANVKNFSLMNFLGAFRYKGWETPPITKSKSHFKWVLVSRKLNQKRNGM